MRIQMPTSYGIGFDRVRWNSFWIWCLTKVCAAVVNDVRHIAVEFWRWNLAFRCLRGRRAFRSLLNTREASDSAYIEQDQELYIPFCMEVQVISLDGLRNFKLVYPSFGRSASLINLDIKKQFASQPESHESAKLATPSPCNLCKSCRFS